MIDSRKYCTFVRLPACCVLPGMLCWLLVRLARWYGSGRYFDNPVVTTQLAASRPAMEWKGKGILTHLFFDRCWSGVWRFRPDCSLSPVVFIVLYHINNLSSLTFCSNSDEELRIHPMFWQVLALLKGNTNLGTGTTLPFETTLLYLYPIWIKGPRAALRASLRYAAG